MGYKYSGSQILVFIIITWGLIKINIVTLSPKFLIQEV